MFRLRLLSLTGVVAGMMLGMGVLAFGSGDARAQAPTVEGTVEGAVAAWNDEDAEAFLGYFTPEGWMAVSGVEPTVEAVQADMEETGPIADYSVTDLKLAGGDFTATVELTFEVGFVLYQIWTFDETDDGWVVSGAEELSRPIPPGVPAVDMTLQEYAFVYSEAAINAADGNFAFDVTNAGEEEHEIVVFAIDSDKPLLELLESADLESEEEPEGLSFAAFGGFFAPGTSGTAVFDQPFAPGKYGLACFVSSPDGIPHAFLGMVSEFTVSGGLAPAPGGGGGITPPNTGDAGLLDTGYGTASWLVLSLALTLVLGGTIGLVRSRS